MIIAMQCDYLDEDFVDFDDEGFSAGTPLNKLILFGRVLGQKIKFYQFSESKNSDNINSIYITSNDEIFIQPT